MKDWKTTLAGLGAVVVAVGHMLSALGTGTGIAAADLMAVATGIGLIFAKDSSKAQ